VAMTKPFKSLNFAVLSHSQQKTTIDIYFKLM